MTVPKRPSADDVQALRRDHARELKKLGDARRVYEADLRSGWDALLYDTRLRLRPVRQRRGRSPSFRLVPSQRRVLEMLAA